MSDYESDTGLEAPAENYSLAEEYFSGAVDYDDQDDDSYESGYEEEFDDGDEDYFSEEDYQRQAIADAVAQGVAPYAALLQGGAEGERQWAEMQAQMQYDAYVRDYAAREQAAEVAEEIIDDYGQQYGIPESERAAILPEAQRLFAEANAELFNAGYAGTDVVARLHSPEGAELALEYAAIEASQRRAGLMAWSSEERGGWRPGALDITGNAEHHEWAHKARAEWQASEAGRRAAQRLAEWRDRR